MFPAIVRRWLMKRTERRAEQRGGGRFNQARPNHRDDGCRECDDRDQKAYEETTECVCLYRARQIQQQQKEIEDVDDGIEKKKSGWMDGEATGLKRHLRVPSMPLCIAIYYPTSCSISFSLRRADTDCSERTHRAPYTALALFRVCKHHRCTLFK